MKIGQYFFLLFGIIFAILNCSENLTSVSLKPEKMILISGSADTTAVERGIDAVPEVNGILIQWIPLSDPSIKHYEIWRSDDKNQLFSHLINVSVSDSIYIDETVEFYVKYFYYLVAVNEDNKKGESSDTLSYTLFKKAIHLNPLGEITNTVPALSWEDPNGASEYIIRINDPRMNECIWLAKKKSTYSNREEAVYNFDSSAKMEYLEFNQEYYWRVDVVGSSHYTDAGSESEWTVIRILEN